MYSRGVTSLALSDGKTVRLQVDKTLMPDSSSAWGYYVLVGAFDGLAQDLWRDAGQGPWQVGAKGCPFLICWRHGLDQATKRRS